MIDKIKLLLSSYKEIQGLIVDLIQLIFYIVAGYKFISPYLNDIPQQPLYLKTLFILCILLFIITIYRNFKKFINRAKYEIAYSSLILGQLSESNGEKLIYEFNKIIPSSKILTYLHDKILNDLKKWSSDTITLGADLWFNNRNGKNFSYSLSVRYYSPSKKIAITCPINDLKIPKGKIIEKCNLSYSNNPLPHFLFFKQNNWHKAMVMAFSHIESEIIGKTFTCVISDGLHEARIQIMPEYGNSVSKSFVFYYENSELLDESRSIINTVR